MVNRRALTGLLTAEAISITGSRMSLVALPWLVLGATGSPILTGVVAAIETTPYVASGVLGAPLIDRIGARRASIIADALSFVAMGAIPFLYHLGISVLAPLVFLVGAFRGISDLSKKVLLPMAVEQTAMQLSRATALYDGISRFSALAGGPAAGALIAWLDASAVILVDAVSFALCAAVVAGTVRSRRPSGQTDTPTAGALAATNGEAREGYVVALRRGLQYLRQDRLILSVVIMMFAINLFDNAALSVYIPMWAKGTVGSPIALGLCSGAFALGAMVGNVGIIALAERVPRYATLTVGLLVGGAPRFLSLGLSDSVVFVVVIMFAAGIGFAAINPVIAVVMYERIPVQLQARVFGVATAAAFAGMPLGSLLGGLSVQSIGFTTSLVLAGVLCFTATLTPVLARRTWRQMNIVRQPTADSSRPAVPNK
ncbi:MFS transporter [Streptomyces sp. NPDC090029]|uniref:MFS transporter n=1 Tax=Streptomyces sp. NPDC090029 TaxID=3365924 RepID=UPI003812B845